MGVCRIAGSPRYQGLWPALRLFPGSSTAPFYSPFLQPLKEFCAW